MGNIRLSYTQDPITNVLTILEENNYYPFGLKHRNYNMGKKHYEKLLYEEGFEITPTNETVYDYKYNGKEWQDELGLNFYDYGARNYDPAIGRWMNIDPLAEVNRRWTPYRYAYNNPLVFIDPDGMLETDFGVNDKGEVKQIGPTDDKPDRLFKLNDNGSIDKSVAPITVNDKELLPQLTPESADVVTMANGEDSTKDVTVNIATTDAKNKNDAFNVFKFMADNTSVEWSLGKINYKGLGTNYQLGTYHQDDLSPGMRNSEIGTVLGLVHSHPNPKTESERNESISGDLSVGRNFLKKYGSDKPYLIYFPSNNSTLKIGVPQDASIKGGVTTKKVNSFKF